MSKCSRLLSFWLAPRQSRGPAGRASPPSPQPGDGLSERLLSDARDQLPGPVTQAVARALCSGAAPLAVMLCCHCLEILNHFISNLCFVSNVCR